MNKSCWMWLAAGWLAVTLASAEELLPGPVLFHLKEAERIIERAEKAYAAAPAAEPRRTKALQAVQVDVDAALAKMAEIEQRFPGEVSPFHADMRTVQKRIDDLEERIRDSREEEEPPVAEAAPPEALPLPAGARPPLAAVSGLPPLSGSGAYWLARLRPFVTRSGQPGHDPARYLEPLASSDPARMQQRLDIYAQALATLTEYRQARLGAAAPLELQQVAVDIEDALKRFGLSCIEHANDDLVEAQQSLQEFEQFVRAQDKRMATAEPIELLDRDRLRQVEATILRAARLVRPDDPCLVDVRQRLAVLKRNDARLRAARAADTLMLADGYAGPDAVALKQVAGRTAMDAQPGIRVLKVSLVSPDWRTESFVEWSDFDQTVLQPRVEQTMTAHVAVQYNAETRRYTVALRQSRLPSGRWGPVSGEVLFVDPMLLDNVNR